MGKLVILKLDGDLEQQGFRVTAEIGAEGDRAAIEVTGALPADPALVTHLNHWQQVYRSLGGANRIMPQEIIYGGSVNRLEDCRRSSYALRNQLNSWLESASFRTVDQHLRETLSLTEPIRVVLRTQNNHLRRLPWHLWDFIDHYSNAEIALGAQTFKQIEPVRTRRPTGRASILAILGNSTGINIESDRALLEHLPDAEVTFLVEPPRQQVNQQLWEQSWDILFFAGHSQSETEQGRIYINPQESLTLDELKYGLRQAIAQGLQFAIFNSCDGLGLARELEQLYLPQMIVMREPVPDPVAQAFLRHFLAAFVRGEPLYPATRQAREQLQGLEGQFPCASWLPVICQSSLNQPIHWHELVGRYSSTTDTVLPQPKSDRPKSSSQPFSWQSLRLVLLISSIITSLVMGLRLLGTLQPIELLALDHLMRLRPTEPLDNRLLLITIDESDLTYQNQHGMQRQGSLSDQALHQLLAKLEPHRPAAIGLDIYRDRPAFAHQIKLKTQLQQLIYVCRVASEKWSFFSVTPPSKLPLTQVGFSNLPVDPDQVIRRQTIGMAANQHCKTERSFAYQLALRYLAHRNLRETWVDGTLHVGHKRFPKLEFRTGGYHQPGVLGGYEVLLNYRNAHSIAKTASLSDVLEGSLDTQLAEAVRDRIILIGTVAHSFKDYHQTPDGELAGVELQAQMVSQLLSAVLDDRPLLWCLPQWGDGVWIWGWAMVSGMLALRLPSRLFFGLGGCIAVGCLYGLCFLVLLRGGWMPLIPSALALIGTGGSVIVWQRKLFKS